MRESTRKKLDDVFVKNTAVGASTATIGSGVIVNQEVFGLSNSRAGIEVDSNTRFQAASISKTVNAVAVLTLVNRGVVAIDAPVNSYLSRWQLRGNYGDIVTIKHLLSHCGGTTVHGFKGYTKSDALPGIVEILEGGANSNSPVVVSEDPPGETYKYSGGGTTALQALIEDSVGTSYEDFVLEAVFKPLGMSKSVYSAPLESIGFSCAHNSGGNPIRGDYRRHPEKAAAGLWTTPTDLAKLLIDLFRSLQGERDSILPIELTSLMINRVIADSGLGVYLLPDDRISHSGANYGFRSYFSFNVRTGNGVVAMSNSERGARTPAQLMNAILKERRWV